MSVVPIPYIWKGRLYKDTGSYKADWPVVSNVGDVGTKRFGREEDRDVRVKPKERNGPGKSDGYRVG